MWCFTPNPERCVQLWLQLWLEQGLVFVCTHWFVELIVSPKYSHFFKITYDWLIPLTRDTDLTYLKHIWVESWYSADMSNTIGWGIGIQSTEKTENIYSPSTLREKESSISATLFFGHEWEDIFSLFTLRRGRGIALNLCSDNGSDFFLFLETGFEN